MHDISPIPPDNNEASDKLAGLNRLYATIKGEEVYNSNITPRNKALYGAATILTTGLAGLAWLTAPPYVIVLFVVSILTIALLVSRDHQHGKYKQGEAQPRHSDAGEGATGSPPSAE